MRPSEGQASGSLLMVAPMGNLLLKGLLGLTVGV